MANNYLPTTDDESQYTVKNTESNFEIKHTVIDYYDCMGLMKVHT